MVKPLILISALSLLLATPVLAVEFDDVLRMLEARVDEGVILRLVDQERAVFYLDADDILDLQYAGASDWFLEEMIDRSTEPPKKSSGGYNVYDDYNVYVHIGHVYDPFDYYFVTGPYYYAYVSPWRWNWSWWYYGGPIHAHWCNSWNWRVHYYNDYWGPRTVWHRGYRDRHYQVPRYDVSEKVVRRAVYDRSLSSAVKEVRQRADRTGRAISDRKIDRKRSPRATTDRKQPVWGRNDRTTRSQTPSRTPQRSVRTPRSSPQQGSSTPPRAPSVRTPRSSPRQGSTTPPRAPSVRTPRSTNSPSSPPRSTSRSSSGSKTPSRPSRSGSR